MSSTHFKLESTIHTQRFVLPLIIQGDEKKCTSHFKREISLKPIEIPKMEGRFKRPDFQPYALLGIIDSISRRLIGHIVLKRELCYGGIIEKPWSKFAIVLSSSYKKYHLPDIESIEKEITEAIQKYAGKVFTFDHNDYEVDRVALFIINQRRKEKGLPPKIRQIGSDGCCIDDGPPSQGPSLRSKRSKHGRFGAGAMGGGN